MRFPNETPLDQVLKHIKMATKKGPNDPGIPIYVDPVGLQIVQKTWTSTVKIDADGLPLKVSLRQILRQLGLEYLVNHDVLIISAPKEISSMRSVSVGQAADGSAATKHLLAKLAEPISMPFRYITPLDEVLKFIRQATRTSADGPETAIFVDPIGLQRVDKAPASEVHFELEGVPLKTSPWLVLRQLGLVYAVKNGTLVISSSDRIQGVQPPVRGMQRTKLKR